MRSLALSSLIHAGLLGLAVIAGWRVVSAGLRRTEEVVISPALPFVDPFDSTPEPPPLESPPEEAQEKEPKLVEPRFADSYLERSPWELEREFEAPHRGEGFFLDPILDREKPEPSDPPVGGERFLDEAGVACLREVLLPTGPILTPNLGEAAELCGMEKKLLQTDFDSRIEAAERLLEMGAVAVLLKGGHGTEDPVRDLVLERGSEPLWRTHERVRGASMRGSGCRYGSAVAALLALGQPLSEAARRAGEELVEWIRRAKFCAAEGSR